MASLIPVERKSVEERIALLDKISEKTNEKFGKEIIGRIGARPEIMEQLTIKFIPTPSAELNKAIGGGFPRRRCSIVVGKEDSGKTSLMLETIAKNMKENPEFVAGWLESENSLEKDYVCETFGIDPNRFFLVNYDSNIGSEKTLDIVEKILMTDSVDMFVVNSLKCLVPDKEIEASLSDAVVAVQARMNARMTRKFNLAVSNSHAAFVIITHLSTDINSMSRDPLIVSGGIAIRYWAALILDLRKRSIAPSGEIINATEGVKIAVTVKKNHCIPSQNPYVKLEYYAVFGEGIEQILSSLDTAIQQGVLEPHGNWLYWQKDGETIEKFSGKAAFRTFMKENPDKFKDYLNQLGGKNLKIEALSDAEIKQVMDEQKEIEKTVVMSQEELKAPKKNKKKVAS